MIAASGTNNMIVFDRNLQFRQNNVLERQLIDSTGGGGGDLFIEGFGYDTTDVNVSAYPVVGGLTCVITDFDPNSTITTTEMGNHTISVPTRSLPQTIDLYIGSFDLDPRANFSTFLGAVQYLNAAGPVLANLYLLYDVTVELNDLVSNSGTSKIISVRGIPGGYATAPRLTVTHSAGTISSTVAFPNLRYIDNLIVKWDFITSGTTGQTYSIFPQNTTLYWGSNITLEFSPVSSAGSYYTVLNSSVSFQQNLTLHGNSNVAGIQPPIDLGISHFVSGYNIDVHPSHPNAIRASTDCRVYERATRRFVPVSVMFTSDSPLKLAAAPWFQGDVVVTTFGLYGDIYGANVFTSFIEAVEFLKTRPYPHNSTIRIKGAVTHDVGASLLDMSGIRVVGYSAGETIFANIGDPIQQVNVAQDTLVVRFSASSGDVAFASPFYISDLNIQVTKLGLHNTGHLFDINDVTYTQPDIQFGSNVSISCQGADPQQLYFIKSNIGMYGQIDVKFDKNLILLSKECALNNTLSVPGANTYVPLILNIGDGITSQINFRGEGLTIVGATDIAKTISGYGVVNIYDTTPTNAPNINVNKITATTVNVVPTLTSTSIPNSSGVVGTTVTAALNQLNQEVSNVLIPDPVVRTSDFNADSQTIYFVDYNIAASPDTGITATLPLFPFVGDQIRFIDYANQFTTYNLTINRNGQKIDGANSNKVVNTNGAWVDLIYVDSNRGWITKVH